VVISAASIFILEIYSNTGKFSEFSKISYPIYNIFSGEKGVIYTGIVELDLAP